MRKKLQFENETLDYGYVTEDYDNTGAVLVVGFGEGETVVSKLHDARPGDYVRFIGTENNQWKNGDFWKKVNKTEFEAAQTLMNEILHGELGKYKGAAFGEKR